MLQGELTTTRLLSVWLRGYTDSDAEATLAIFSAAIQELACADYNAQQLEAWVGAAGDLASWHRARSMTNTQVAVIDEQLVGFSDVNADGHIDMLFVDPKHTRIGVAEALVNWARATAQVLGATELSTHASITARTFFEKQGFELKQERTPVIDGIGFINYLMLCPLI